MTLRNRVRFARHQQAARIGRAILAVIMLTALMAANEIGYLLQQSR